MEECLIEIQHNILGVLEYSGRSLMQLGSYYDCLAQPSLNYNLILIQIKGQPMIFSQIGLCLPSICNKTEIHQAIDQFLSFIHSPYEVLAINNQIPDYRYNYTWIFFLAIVITLISILLLLGSTLFPHKYKISMFSIQQSSKVFKRNAQSPLNVFNGIKSICMMWVVLGHIFTSLIGSATNLITSVQENVFLAPFFLLVEAGLFSVDVFFLVGGFLLSYVLLKQTSKDFYIYPISIIQRILRFWPSYFYAILIYYSIYLHIGQGPNWGSDQQMVKYCDSMWQSLFFVDNLVDNGEQQCMNWGWYLQNDMQLFILSVILLFIYNKQKRISKFIIWIIIFSSLVFTFVWTYSNQTFVITHFKDVSKWSPFFLNVYIKPWARCPPYLLGVFFGILYIEYLEQIKQKLKEKDRTDKAKSFFFKCSQLFKTKKIIRISFQLFGVFLMLFLILIPRTLQLNYQWPQWLHSLYHSSAKFIFTIALFVTIFPGLLGCKCSFVYFTMDTDIFNYISKISFCTYLIHLTVLDIWANSRTSSRYYTIVSTLSQYGGILFISMILGLFMTFIIQIPCSKLQKKLMSFIKRKMSSNKQQETKVRDLDKNKQNAKVNVQSLLLQQNSMNATLIVRQ